MKQNAQQMTKGVGQALFDIAATPPIPSPGVLSTSGKFAGAGVCVEGATSVRWIGYGKEAIPRRLRFENGYGTQVAAIGFALELAIAEKILAARILTNCEWVVKSVSTWGLKGRGPLGRGVRYVAERLKETGLSLQWAPHRSRPGMDGAVRAAELAGRGSRPDVATLLDEYENALIFGGCPGGRSRARIGVLTDSSNVLIPLCLEVVRRLGGATAVATEEIVRTIEQWTNADFSQRPKRSDLSKSVAQALGLGWPDRVFLRWIFHRGSVPARHEIAIAGGKVYDALEESLRSLGSKQDVA